jgi:RNA polymerase sigma-70 factor (ECF subfamily)
MNDDSSRSAEVRRLVLRARDGDAEAVGELLEAYRGYLRRLTQYRLAAPLQRRLDASDVVQQTFLEAHRNFAGFAGASEGEWLAWLRTILQANIANAVRDNLVSKKRALGMETSFDDSHGGVPMRARVRAEAPSPSSEAIRLEQSLKFLDAIAALPPDQARAVRMRHLEGFSLMEIAQAFGRSESAVAGLIKRGVQGLRDRLGSAHADY